MEHTYLYNTLEKIYTNIDTSIDECITLYGFIKFKGPDYIVNIHDSISVVEYSSAVYASQKEIIEDFDTIKDYIYDMLSNLLYLYGADNKGCNGVTTHINRYHCVRYNLDDYHEYLKTKEYEHCMEYVYFLRYFGMYAHYDGYRGRMIFSTNSEPCLDVFIKKATDFDVLEYNSDTKKLRLHNRKTNTNIRVAAFSLLDNDMFSRYATDHVMSDNKLVSSMTYKIIHYTISPKYIRPLPVKQFGHTGLFSSSPTTKERPNIAKHNIGEHPGDDHVIDAMMYSIDSMNRKDAWEEILKEDWERTKPKYFTGKIGEWLNERI